MHLVISSRIMESTNPWARGTNLPKSTQAQKQPTSQTLFDQLKSKKSIDLLNEIKEVLLSFDSAKHSLPDFLTKALGSLETCDIEKLIEFILTQPKARDLFRQETTKCDVLALIIVGLLKGATETDSKDIYTRFLSHVIFCNMQISDDCLLKIYQSVQKAAFNTLPQQLKLQKSSLNCITNILSPQESSQTQLCQPIIDQIDFTFKKLKDILLDLCKVLRTSYKSKRQIILLTTVIRAFQIAMDRGVQYKKVLINEAEAVILFTCLYKMVFLGTKFTERVLQIQVQQGKKEKSPVIMYEESKKDYQSPDLSEGGSSMSDAFRSLDEGQVLAEVQEKIDSYLKIKTHAMQCLLTLFKVCNKAFTLKGLWMLIFPSILTSPSPQVLNSLHSDSELQTQVEQFVASDLLSEPTMFYLAKTESSIKQRTQALLSINVLLENSDFIKKLQDGVDTTEMGKFLHLLHSLVVCLLKKETDSQMTLMILKLCNTLLTVTPYDKMSPGMASILIREIYSQESKPNGIITQYSNLHNLALKIVGASYSIGLPEVFKSDFIVNMFLKSYFNQSEIYETSIFVLTKAATNFPAELNSMWGDQNLQNGVQAMLFPQRSPHQDQKKLTLAVKFLAEWVNATPQSQPMINVVSRVYSEYFNAGQSAEVNLTLLDILHHLPVDMHGQYFAYVTGLCKSTTPTLRAAAIYCASLVMTEETKLTVLQQVLSLAQDSHLQVMIRNSQACSLLAQSQATHDQDLFKLILKYCQSGKEKTTANGIRALGYLNIPATNEVEKILIDALGNRSPKITWNSCVAIAKFVQRGSSERLKSVETTEILFEIVSSRANLKSRIQAAAALMAYPGLAEMGGNSIIGKAWESLNECMNHKTEFRGSQAELKYLEQLEVLWLDLWVRITGFTTPCDEIRVFINQYSNHLLQRICDYLRKELKVPKYSEMFDDTEVFNRETEAIFFEKPELEAKLNKVKTLTEKVTSICESDPHVKVSFAVFESFKQLAKSSVKQYRGLRVLKEAKSIFVATFEEPDPITLKFGNCM